MVGTFISGFSGTSSGSNPGTHAMADDKDIKNKVKPTKKFEWDETDEACAYIKGAIETKPCQPVVIVGHSLGGDTAVQVAECLEKDGICVDLLIQIESVGVGDEKKPDKVRKGVNIWSRSRKGINGASWVEGSENIAVDGTDHTSIDEKDDKGKVKNGGSEHDGLGGWDLVKKFIGQLKEPFCNCPKETAMVTEDASLAENIEPKIMTAIKTAAPRAVSIEELQEMTKVEAQYLVPAFRKLLQDKAIKKVVGLCKLQYFALSQDGNGESSC